MTDQNMQSAAQSQPVVDLSKAPMPNVKTLKSRYNLFGQLGKFIAFNLRIMKMVLNGGGH
jgi:hypothetical protein